jgi:hypothetical protein
MGRPAKPRIGTPERLEMDLAECYPIYRFMAQQIANDPRKPGRILRAQMAAVDKFKRSMTTVKRHYALIATSIQTGAMDQWRVNVAASRLPEVNDKLEKIQRAFTPTELTELEPVGIHLVSEFAEFRLRSRSKQRNRK